MAENYSFSVVLEPQEGGGFTVLVPALPEVVTEGDTEQEALANAEDAIRAVLWYQTDERFKHAVEQYTKVKTNVQVEVAAEDKSNDFSREKIFGPVW